MKKVLNTIKSDKGQNNKFKAVVLIETLIIFSGYFLIFNVCSVGYMTIGMIAVILAMVLIQRATWIFASMFVSTILHNQLITCFCKINRTFFVQPHKTLLDWKLCINFHILVNVILCFLLTFYNVCILCLNQPRPKIIDGLFKHMAYRMKHIKYIQITTIIMVGYIVGYVLYLITSPIANAVLFFIRIKLVIEAIPLYYLNMAVFAISTILHTVVVTLIISIIEYNSLFFNVKYEIVIFTFLTKYYTDTLDLTVKAIISSNQKFDNTQRTVVMQSKDTFYFAQWLPVLKVYHHIEMHLFKIRFEYFYSTVHLEYIKKIEINKKIEQVNKTGYIYLTLIN